ncbi:hypothetical protein PM082_002271 [Marasmius tenuissimus]|nr:hypothetical protein PM082_002271 [Marasmius tenuissimus]
MHYTPLLIPALLTITSLAAVPRDVESRSAQAFGGRFTYYQTGLGACGAYNNPSDYIVALNSAQYGGGYPGPNCNKSITISYDGKTHDATIVDECPTCDHGDLDLSQGLFEFFAPTSTGVLQGEWWFN